MGLYVRLAIGLAVAAALGWVIRVDHLRARYKTEGEAVVSALHDAGYNKTSLSLAPVSIKLMADARDKARSERDKALSVVDVQSRSIDEMGREAAQAKIAAEQQRKLIDATLRERDAWIARAKSAETRTQRKSDQEEVAECNRVLDDLYANGF